MSPCVMVTAYFASSCWISTRSSVRDELVGTVILEDLTVFHYKVDASCNADIGEWIAGHGDDVRQVALGDAAEVRLVDQIRCHHGRGAQHRRGRHTPIHKRDKLIGVLSVWNRRGVCAEGDLYARLVCRLDRRPRLREHLGGLVLQLL